jgi:hypothetical protein
MANLRRSLDGFGAADLGVALS